MHSGTLRLFQKCQYQVAELLRLARCHQIRIEQGDQGRLLQKVQGTTSSKLSLREASKELFWSFSRNCIRIKTKTTPLPTTSSSPSTGPTPFCPSLRLAETTTRVSRGPDPRNAAQARFVWFFGGHFSFKQPSPFARVPK